MIDSIQDKTEIPADPQEEQIPQTSTSVVAARSKAKAKPQPRELAMRVTEDPEYCTTSRAILAQCMEKASRRGILGRY